MIEYALLLFYMILIFLGIKEFIIWNQISVLMMDDNTNNRFDILINLYQSNHPHALRATLVYPILEFGRIFYISEKLFYSIVLVLLLFFSYKMIKKILNILLIKQTLPILIFLFLLSYFMNGRIIFAIFGNMLIVYAIFMNEWNNSSIVKLIYLLFTGLFFITVSSGTFSVGLLTILLVYFLQFIIFFPRFKKKYLSIYFSLFGLFIIVVPFLIMWVEKNMNYYGGSFINMLNHGYGKFIVNNEYLLIGIFLIFLLLIIIILIFLSKNSLYIIPFSQMIAAFIVGLFGYTSFFSGILGYILFFYFYLNRKTIGRISF